MTYQGLYYCDAFDFLAQMPDCSVDHVFADPIYDKGEVWLGKLLTECFRVIRPGGTVLCFEKPGIYWRTRPTKIYHWEKPPSPKNTSKQVCENMEDIYVWHSIFNGPKITKMSWHNYNSVRHDIVEGPQLSGMQKPESLVRWLGELHTRPGQSVFVPFCGTGTFIKVLQDIGRVAFGCDDDFKMCKISQDRTGLTLNATGRFYSQKDEV